MVVSTAVVMWFVMGIICLVLGLMMPGFLLIFFGIGALVTALLSVLFPLSLMVQLVIFLLSSLVLLATLRTVLNRRFPGKNR